MSEDYAIESLDTGLRLPILYNIVSAVGSMILSVSYIIILARVLVPQEFLIYTSIFTLYNFLAMVLSSFVQWTARDYVRSGDTVVNKFSGIYSFSLIISLITVPLTVFLLKDVGFTPLVTVALYSVSIIFYTYALLTISLVASRYFNLIVLINNLVKFTGVLAYLFYSGRLSYIVPLGVEVVGYLVSGVSTFLLSRSKVSPKLFIPSLPTIDYLSRVLKLSIANYLHMIRSNLGYIHYFLAYILGLGAVIVNSIWIIYRVLNWGKAFFRGFFVVIYSRQFYRRMGEYDFKDYINIVTFFIAPLLTISVVMHKPFTSLFNPGYIDLSPLFPMSIFLVLLEVIRISYVFIILGLEEVDKSLDALSFKEVYSSRFFKITYLQFKILTFFLGIVTIVSIFLMLGSNILIIPYLLIFFIVLETLLDNIYLHRFLKRHRPVSYDFKNILIMFIATIPSGIFLYFYEYGELVVNDIFPDSIPVVKAVIISFSIYVLFSLVSGWVRKEFIKLLKFIIGRLIG